MRWALGAERSRGTSPSDYNRCCKAKKGLPAAFEGDGIFRAGCVRTVHDGWFF